MTCDELKKSAQRGQLQAKLAEPKVRAHLSQCAECEALYGAEAPLARMLVAGGGGANAAPSATLDSRELDALLQELNLRVQQETENPWNVLRDKRTSVRRGAVLVAVVIVFLLCLWLRARADLSRYPLSRLVIELAVLFAVVGAAVAEATRPLAEPANPKRRLAILAACVATPFVLALVSWLLPVTKTEGTSDVQGIGGCMLWGTAAAFPALLVLLLSKRLNPWEEGWSPLSAATLGVIGNLLLQIHCPSSEFVHLMSAHAPLLIVFGLVLALWARMTDSKNTDNGPRTPEQRHG